MDYYCIQKTNLKSKLPIFSKSYKHVDKYAAEKDTSVLVNTFLRTTGCFHLQSEILETSLRSLLPFVIIRKTVITIQATQFSTTDLNSPEVFTQATPVERVLFKMNFLQLTHRIHKRVLSILNIYQKTPKPSYNDNSMNISPYLPAV